ncbi:MAG: mannanase [Erythrobacter sp.]|uniref:glycoside hydrolase 5 family protein n=1 Tax=Erythrobacter sp. TaxID=1042 RepID=UPI0025F93B09|nr:mannanase [Erythrobacter sp.]MCL9999156.1 mannanase [Erythrobacter sp.]
MTFTRRESLAGSAAGALALAAGGHAASAAPSPSPDFVTRDGTRLLRGGKPYRITGANLWYAAWLGADADYGDRARLLRELDRLQALGINNLRVMAAAEEGPLRNSIKPGFTRADGSANAALFEGLDFALAEIAKRGMTAVLVLSNFWEWSGGMQTLLHRATGTYIDMGDPAHPWPAFADATAAFYANTDAVARYREHVVRLLGRRNTVSDVDYTLDSAIMAWQLANEPRPGGSDAAIAANRAAYLAWIADTAALIRAGAPQHLVSLGQEGTQATNGDALLVADAHAAVDYVTAHIWPLNWSWVKGDDLAGTWPEGRRKVEAYIAAHVRIAEQSAKPLVIEEFGFPRDAEAYAPAAATTFREDYYRVIYAAVEASWASGAVIAGSNFWAWNGEARAAHPDARFRDGDRAYMGDPPHEPQGWYGVFGSDAAMLEVIRAHVARAAA